MGSMNELGEIAEREHRKIGKLVGRYADVLVTVGVNARFIAEEAGLNGISTENIAAFPEALAAAEYVKSQLSPDTVILVKGSQNNVRLEKLVKEIMMKIMIFQIRMTYWLNLFC